MNREVSIFLDLARFLAAVTVFLTHASWNSHTGGLLWQIRDLGSDAVDVFFVLSGFVIAHVTTTRERGGRDYAINRIARVASVALPALAATWLLDAIGMAVRPAHYSGFCCEPGTAWEAYLRNLFFLGEIWSQHITPGSNVPYWSLGYEVPYYAAFGLYAFLPPRLGLAAAAAVLALAGPGIAVLFPLWLLGTACHGRKIAPRMGWTLLTLGTTLLAITLLATHRTSQIYAPFALTADRLPDYARDYAIGIGFAALLTGFIAVSPHFAAPLRAIERPVRWLAGGTFALYLFHLPLLHMLTAILPFPALSWQNWLAVYTCVPLACFALAEVTERRKTWWRATVDRLIPGKPQ